MPYGVAKKKEKRKVMMGRAVGEAVQDPSEFVGGEWSRGDTGESHPERLIPAFLQPVMMMYWGCWEKIAGM